MSGEENKVDEGSEGNEAAEPVVESKETLTTGLEVEEKEVSSVPEGIEKDLYDEESRSLKIDAVKEALKKRDADIENYKKQATDMRRKLSKGVEAPKDIKEYSEKYVPNEKYSPFVEDKESEVGKHINSVMGVLDDFAFNHGLSVDTAKDFKDLVLGYMEDVQIIDSRTPEDKAKANAKFLKEQREVLGDDADEIIRENLSFFKNYNVFNEDEKKLLIGSFASNAAWNSIGMKIRKLFGGNSTSDIPVNGVAINGLSDDVTLAKEYNNSNTSTQRRMQILQQRIDAGRKGKLPTVF